jgi:4-hydroxy-tetrahydrodipicolinate reductase
MPTPLKVCLSGATGGVGKCLARAILARDDFVLESAVARAAAGKDLGAAIGRPSGACGVVVTDDLGAALDRRPDVLIDYTHPSVRMANVMAAVERKVPMVIGTTGFSSAEFEEIDHAARQAGIGLATGNFSLTAALLQRFAVMAAGHLPHYTVLEYCKAEKPDVPSGTAREVAELMAEVRRPDYRLSADDHIGYRDALGAEIDGVRVHAVRLPGYSAGVEVLFGLQGERLTLRHEMGTDDSIFVEGSLLAARKVQGFTGLVRGLDKLIFGG